jgi:uncharacterized protein YydD (DUF2326 family)
MRLVSLIANKNTFHPVTFNETGLTLIVGKQKETEEDSSKRTFNGVGKSLIVDLIHYCLGSNRIPSLEEKLSDWEFQLKFKHENEEFTARRAVKDPTKIVLNNDELKISHFNKTLQDIFFPQLNKYKGLSFRDLLKLFIRTNRSAYEAYDSSDFSGETDYKKQLRLAYLLGLEIGYAIEKCKFKKELEELRKKQKQFKKDELLKSFCVGDSNPDIELNELSLKIKKLQVKLRNYKVAEDYHSKQCEANDVTYSLQQLRNKQEMISKALTQVNQSLAIKPDIEPERIYSIYEEANVSLPDLVKNKIQKVTKFHSQLLQMRTRKLAEEKRRLKKILEGILDKVNKLNEQRDALLHYLGTHGALDEYTALSNELAKMKARYNKIVDYQKLLRQYSDKQAQIEMKMKKNNVETNQYLEDIHPLIESNMEAFTTFSKRFYEEKPGGLAVKNNEGDNQVRFDIKAKIQDDASDGINEVKIFCFDMTILTQKHNHLIDLIFHDSRLFSDMDSRQRAIALELASEISTQGNFQYIATINQDQLESSSHQWSNEIKDAIYNNIVLELTDEGPESKLLGIQIDM